MLLPTLFDCEEFNPDIYSFAEVQSKQLRSKTFLITTIWTPNKHWKDAHYFWNFFRLICWHTYTCPVRIILWHVQSLRVIIVGGHLPFKSFLWVVALHCSRTLKSRSKNGLNVLVKFLEQFFQCGALGADPDKGEHRTSMVFKASVRRRLTPRLRMPYRLKNHVCHKCIL